MRAAQPCMNADGARRPGGTRPHLLVLVMVQGWLGAPPHPRWLCSRWAFIEQQIETKPNLPCNQLGGTNRKE